MFNKLLGTDRQLKVAAPRSMLPAGQRRGHMNRALTALMLSIAASGCSVPGNPMNWAFVQSVGGITVHQPIVKTGDWVLPLNVDVSGQQAFSTKPTKLNSGLSCQSVQAQTESSAIYLTVMVAVAEPNGKTECSYAKTGTLSPGNYKVFYRGPNEQPVLVGEVTVSE